MAPPKAVATPALPDLLDRDDGGDRLTSEQLRVTETVLGQLAKRYMTVRALAFMLHDSGGEHHPDPGGWMAGALNLAVAELGVEPFAVVTRTRR